MALKENERTPHQDHGTGNDSDDEDWVFVDDTQVDELLVLLARMRALLLLVLGRSEFDQDDTETCFGEIQL